MKSSVHTGYRYGWIVLGTVVAVIIAAAAIVLTTEVTTRYVSGSAERDPAVQLEVGSEAAPPDEKTRSNPPTPESAGIPTAEETASGSVGSNEATAGLGLVDPRNLTVCTTIPYAPFVSLDFNGQPVGFDIAYMSLLADRLGVGVAIKDVPFDEIAGGQALNDGMCDVAAAAITITQERSELVLFSETYYQPKVGILSRSDSNIVAESDLEGLQIGALNGTAGLDLLVERGLSVTEFGSEEALIASVLAGVVDAGAQDEWVVYPAAERHPELSVPLTIATGEEYGFAVKLGAEQLVTEINAVISTADADGTAESLHNSWIKAVG